MSSEPPDDVAAARAHARAQRRAFAASPEGQFARAMQGAMRDYERMRAAGVSREDASRGLEAVLRDSWPRPSTKFPAHCESCDDTGWVERTCWAEQRCGREVCATRHPSFEHAYVVACVCPAGQRHERRAPAGESAIVAAGRSRKPRGWSQGGR